MNQIKRFNVDRKETLSGFFVVLAFVFAFGVLVTSLETSLSQNAYADGAISNHVSNSQIFVNPHIAITEAYANEMTDQNGNYYPHQRIFDGATVHKGQSLQFRMDLSPPAEVLSVDCAIDGKHNYGDACKFDRNTY